MRIYVGPLPWDKAEELKAVTFEHYMETGNYAPYMFMLNGLHSAFRCHDLLNFTWGIYETINGLNGPEGIIRVEGESKTGKRRHVPMSETYFRAVSFMKERLKRPDDEFVHKSVYESATSDVVSVKAATDWVKRWAKKIGVTEPVATHTLRKTWALHAYEMNGCTEDALLRISTALNHASIGTTRTYIGMSLNSESINDLYRNI